MRPQSPPPKPLSLKTPAQCLRYRPPVTVTVWYARSRDLRYAAFLQATGTTTIHPACGGYADAAGETKLARDSNPYGWLPESCRGGEGKPLPTVLSPVNAEVG